MKFYSTILLVVLTIPGLSECQRCAEDIEKQETEQCKDLWQKLEEARREELDAWEAHTEAEKAGVDEKTLSDLKSDYDAIVSDYKAITNDISTYCK